MEAAQPKRYQVLSGSSLKLIAIVTMFIDHIGAAVLEMPAVWDFVGNRADVVDPFFNDPTLSLLRDADIILRLIGRVSFPIFCFLLVEGFLHTRDLKKYMGRMAVFCLLSEIPYNLAFFDSLSAPQLQNVFFTLLLGLAAMAFLRRYGAKSLAGIAGAAACALLAELLRTDYGAFGVVLILIFYLLRERPALQTAAACAALAWEVTAPLALLPIRLYNGQRGRLQLRYLFYLFYPAHILLLWGFRVLIFG